MEDREQDQPLDRSQEERELTEERLAADPHNALNNPVGEPDPTEWPDPYEKREDPRDPPDPDGLPFGEEPHPPTGSTSTSEPHPSQDPEATHVDPPKNDRLDD